MEVFELSDDVVVVEVPADSTRPGPAIELFVDAAMGLAAWRSECGAILSVFEIALA